MTYDILLALITFAFVSSITPGPNNLMLMTSGANFGFRRTIPHMLGITWGHAFMLLIVALGLRHLFETVPQVRFAMQVISSMYLLYLCWKIATATAPKDGQSDGKPFTFLQAAAFQWVNPKGWYMAIYAATHFMPNGHGPWPALTVATVFALTNQPSVAVWAAIGTQIKRLLVRPKLLRVFNWTMALLLMTTLVPVWFG